MKLNYIPAYMPIQFLLRIYQDKTLGFWSDKDFFKVDKILISAAYGIPQKEDFIKINNLEGVKILGDSGGFQNLTQGLSLDPIKVLRWQEKYCIEALTFDEPPTKILGVNTFKPLNEQEYKEKIKINIKNGINMLHARVNNNLKLLLVTHGINYKSLNYNLVELKQQNIELSQFDGVSISYKTSNIYNITEQLLWLMDNTPKNKRVHFLGTSSKHIFLLIKYILFDREDIDFTIDSSSYSNGARTRTLYDKNLKSFNIKTEEPDEKCNCVICQTNGYEIYKSDTLNIAGWLLSLHNLKMYLNYFKGFDNFTKDELIDYIKKYSPKAEKGIIYYNRLKINREKALKMYENKVEQISQEDEINLYNFI